MEISTSDGNSPVKWIYHSCVKWEIKNFFYSRLDRNNVIESEEFITNFNIPIRWRLILRVKEEFGDKYITGIRLWQSETCDNLLSSYVTAHLTLWHDVNKLYGPIKGDFAFSNSVALNFIVFPIDKHIGSHFETNLTNSCEIIIHCDMYFDTSNSPYWKNTDKNLNTLSTDLRTFDFAENLTDLVLKVGSERFPVHSTIVKLRSPCVARLSAQKPDNTEIDLSDKCKGKELKEMIHYWYSGDLYKWPHKELKRFSEVLERMEQYDLKQYCVTEAISLTTTFEKLNVSVTWSIQDDNFFRQLGMLNGEILPVYELEQQSWKLYFYPKGEKLNESHISLCVQEDGEITSTHRAHLEIFFKDGNDEELRPQKTVSKLDSPGKYVFSNFMTHSDFSNLRPTLLLGNTLRIGCRIEYGTGEKTSKYKTEKVSNSESVEAVKHPYEVLADKLKELWKTRELGDVTLETEGGKRLRAHCTILAARSKYFGLYLRNLEPDAVKNSVIEVHDIKSEDLELILNYMYHAEIDLNLALAQKLYPAVRKYKISGLETLCSEYLQSRLNVSCALDVLLMADKSRDSPLKTATLQFVAKNFERISKTPKWQSFRETNPTLAEEITSMATSSR